MHTLVSAFEDGDTARRALERLVDAGFAREDVHLKSVPGDELAADAAADAEIGHRALASAEREVAVGTGALNPIVQFVTRLFGEDGQAETWPEAVRRGHSVVVVDARDEAGAERAALILHELGAVDVNQRAEQSRAEGWDPASQPLEEAPGAEEPRHVANEASYARTIPVEGDSARAFQRRSSVGERPGRERDEGAAAERDNRAHAANRRDESAAGSHRPEPDGEGRGGTDKPAR